MLSRVYVSFVPGGPDCPARALFGPYLSVVFMDGQLFVSTPPEDGEPEGETFRLAMQDEEGWKIHDGEGEDGPVYRGVSFFSLPVDLPLTDEPLPRL